MSQTPYQPTTPSNSTTVPATTGTTSSTTTATPATAAYPYGAYHPSAYATTGTYGYGAYQTGVTGYGWPYPYSYLQQHNQAAAAAAAAAATSAATHFSRPTGVLPPTLPSSTTTAVGTTALSTSQYHSGVTSTTTTSLAAHRTSTFTPSYSYTGRGGKRQSNLRGSFTKELRSLMYGFGDDRNPANDTVNVMEEILIEYITDVCQQAAGPSKKMRLSIDDLRRALSHPADAKKLARMEELLFMQEDIKRARAQFNDDGDIQR